MKGARTAAALRAAVAPGGPFSLPANSSAPASSSGALLGTALERAAAHTQMREYAKAAREGRVSA